ncbi:MAG: hypothetical protein IT310_12240 [Anaerolineales bacterium]|nr:hypothetical protein [Anaerolineales bacterium]
MVKRSMVFLILLLAVLFAPSDVVRAQNSNGDIFLVGQNYSLSSGNTHNGNIVVLGGNVTIESGATLNGDVIVVGGNLQADGAIYGEVALIGGRLDLAGETSGDIALIGGQASLSATAVVNGNISTLGSQLERDPAAKITGEIVNNAPPNVDELSTPKAYFVFDPFEGISGVILKAVGMAIVALLLTLFLDPQIKRVGDYAIAQPVVAGSVGLLALFITVLLAITILPIFVAVCAWVLGVVAIGQEVGRRFVQAINQDWRPLLSTAFGTFLLLLVVGFAGLIPCVGWIFKFALTLVAIGAAVMTRFGSRSGAAPIVAQGSPAG